MEILSLLGYILGFAAILIFGLLVPSYIIYRFMIKRDKITEKEMARVQFPKHFGWVVGIMLVAYNLFFHELLASYEYMPGIGVGLFWLAAFGSLLLALPPKKRGVLSYALATMGTLAGFGFAWRANGFVHSIDGLLIAFSAIWLTAIYVLDSIEWKSLWLIRSLWDWFDQGTTHLLALLKKTFSFKKRKGGNTGLRIVKTVIITAVVLIFFATLLSFADPVFAEIIENIRVQAVERTLLSLVIAAILALLLSFHINTKNIKDKPLNLLNFHDIAIPAVGLVIVFGAFLFIQGTYLFGDQSNLEEFGLTFSEYVRKGFIELLVTTFFAGIINYFLILRQRQESDLGRVNLLRGINLVLILELFALLGSALQRDLIYIDAFSLSRVRIVGAVLLAWLTVCLLLLLAMNFSKKMKEAHFFAGSLAAFALGALWLNVWNMDQMIANSEAGTAGEKDHYYVASLSTDAVDGWGESILAMEEYYNGLLTGDDLDTENEEDVNTFVNNKLTLKQLEQKREGLLYGEATGPAFWNASRHRATKAMEEEPFSETLSCVYEGLRNYQMVNFLDFESQEDARVGLVEYLFISNPYRSSNFFYDTWDYYFSYGESLNTMIYWAINDNEALLAEYEYRWGTLYESYVLDDLQSDTVLLQAFQDTYAPQACR